MDRRRLSLIKSGSTPPTPTLDYLCFTAEEPGSTVAMQAVGSAPSVSLEYSTNGNTWSPFVVGSTTVTLANVGDKVYLRGDNTAFATSDSVYNKFVMTGKVSGSGNIMSIKDKSVESVSLGASYAFCNLFFNCKSLVSAPKLPATTLSSNCYRQMFYYCDGLVSAPELPATVITSGCYNHMFYYCTSLVKPPKLPANKLLTNCYGYMFQYCSKIMLSETQDETYRTPYRIPTNGTGTDAASSRLSMFSGTGGTFRGVPSLNTTYYGAWD